MALRISRFSGALALAASLAMAATPVQARGWGHRHHHHDDIDAGDIFAGLLILGTIAAVASAAGKADKDWREPDYRYPDRDYREPDRRQGGESGSRWRSSRGIDDAVNGCVEEVERSGRSVETVDSVDRDGDGWRVEGRVSGDRTFSCSVSEGGRVRSVTVVDGDAA